MADSSDTRYARTAGGQIAHRVFGEGPLDVIVEAGLNVPVDALLDEPRLVGFLDRLSSFCRHIWFDARGRGASDPLTAEAAQFGESATDDAVALLDSLGLDQVAVVDLAGAALLGQVFAALHPSRTSALVLRHPSARPAQASDTPAGSALSTPDDLSIEDVWGTSVSARFVAPSSTDDERFIAWLARCQRAVASPAVCAWRTNAHAQLDTRRAIRSIAAPTLVLVPTGRDVDAAMSSYVADAIPHARSVELPGDPLFYSGDTGPMLDAIEEFLTGHLPAPALHRVLTTMLFTDIVQSTERATQLGDRRWRYLLERHNDAIRETVQRHHGRLLKLTGDGVLATFDSPGRAIKAACALAPAMRTLGLDIRAGVHTGEVEVMARDIGGISVHTAARVMAVAAPGEVVVSRTVVDLVAGSAIEFEPRGSHRLKGIPGEWEIFAVHPGPP